jgi:hypothetical protein
MATKVQDTLTLSGGSLTTGVKDPQSITKAPEGQFTVTVYAPGATSGSPAVVQLRAWTNSSAKEVLATFTLPVPSGSKANDVYDTLPVYATYDDIDYNVTSVGAATSIVISVTGVGV